jgi:hypothetical protein
VEYPNPLHPRFLAFREDRLSNECPTMPHFPDLPAHMKALPTDARGFPVPWFVEWIDGEPCFPIIDSPKLALAHKLGKCWICGGTLGRYRASVIGPMCSINRIISEPQSHVDCARFAARNCPFLAKPNMKRVPESRLPDERRAPPGLSHARNPGCVAVWIETRPTTPERVGDGVLFHLGEPVSVEWLTQGREATRDEVLDALFSGMVVLEETIMLEPPSERPAARLELNRLVAIAQALAPAEQAAA